MDTNDIIIPESWFIGMWLNENWGENFVQGKWCIIKTEIRWITADRTCGYVKVKNNMILIIEKIKERLGDGKMNLKKKSVSWHELLNIVRKRKSIRCGSTINIDQRRASYNGTYKGTMYYCRTINMELRENALLNFKKWKDNSQQESNAPQEKGYVYIITLE